MPYALLLFVAMPIIEIAVLLRVGSALGWLPTLAIVILTAVIGTAMLRQQGLATLNIAKQRLNSGEMPAEQMLEGVLLLIGGALLLTPGFVTDAFGFAALIPYSRRWMAARIAKRSVMSVGSAGGFSVGSGPGAAHQSGQAPGRTSTTRGGSEGEVIDGDFRRVDD